MNPLLKILNLCIWIPMLVVIQIVKTTKSLAREVRYQWRIMR